MDDEGGEGRKQWADTCVKRWIKKTPTKPSPTKWIGVTRCCILNRATKVVISLQRQSTRSEYCDAIQRSVHGTKPLTDLPKQRRSVAILQPPEVVRCLMPLITPILTTIFALNTPFFRYHSHVCRYHPYFCHYHPHFATSWLSRTPYAPSLRHYNNKSIILLISLSFFLYRKVVAETHLRQ